MGQVRSQKQERFHLARSLRASGKSWVEVAAVLRRRYRINARVALRYAHCWSQRGAADEWNRRWPDDMKTFKNFSYWEQWPNSTGHAPSFDNLSRLAELYECSASDLLVDVADFRHLDPASTFDNTPSVLKSDRDGTSITPAQADELPGVLFDPMKRRTLVQWGVTATSIGALRASWADGQDRVGRFLETSTWPVSRRIGLSDVEAVREMTSLFSRSDQRRGGGHGRGAVMEYLKSDVIPQLNGVYVSEQTRHQMLSAAGELAYLVGWMAFDDSDHVLAREYFTYATKLANEAEDPPLIGHILRAMAHQALDLGLSVEAYNLTTASVEGDRYTRASPRERALLGVIHARSLAVKGEKERASSTLLQAEEELSKASPRSPEPDRMFFFSEASLAHETACALRDLGDLPGANGKFRRSIELRDVSKFTRTHSVTLGYLGDIKARQGEIDEACAVWSECLDAMQGVRSGRTRRVVAEMRATLLPLSEKDRVARELEYRAATYLADSPSS